MDDNDSTIATLDESLRVEAEADYLLNQQDVQLTLQISCGRLLDRPTSVVAQVWYDTAPLTGASPRSTSSLNSCSSCSSSTLALPDPKIAVATVNTETSGVAATDKSPQNPSRNFHNSRAADVKPHATVIKLKTSRTSPSRDPICIVARKYCYALGDVRASRFDRSSLRVEELKSRAVALLLTKLRSSSTTPREFRRVGERLMRLVIEEALVLVPLRRAAIMLSNGRRDAGVRVVLPPCAVSMEQDASPMLELFHDMEPQHPTGYLCFNAEPHAFGPRLLDAHLPVSLAQHDVFLLDHAIESGDRLCAAVHRLQVRGASAAKTIVASLIASTGAIQELQSQYPGVKLITAQIVSDAVRCSNGQVQDSSNLSPV